MKKKIIITSLALAMAMVSLKPAHADDSKIASDKTSKIEENQKEEKITETYIIKEIKDGNVILNKKGNDTDLYSIPKDKFGKMSLEEGKVISITSDGKMLMSNPSQFAKIFEIKEEKADEKKITENFTVKEINDKTVTVEKEGSEGELYSLEKKYFKEDVQVGDKYAISHNDVVMTSFPAIFGKIYEVKEIEAKKEMANVTKIYKVIEVNKDDYTIEYLSEGDGSGLIENSGDLFTLPKEMVKAELKLGDKLKISHSEEILYSNPAQFTKIEKIEKIEDSNNKASENKKEKPSKEKKEANKKEDKKVDNKDKKKESPQNNKGKAPSKNPKKNPKTGVLTSLLPFSILTLSTAGLKLSKKK
ncbi:hypothetical protein [Anaerococcus tetradius]|uniref:hypothetical protein n=1 Tax=Anaerococcus tetradius TaxID=33036 RepID=UPI0023F1FCAA|nr:hypothetical protein [Anaerococcus tetradius]